MLVEPDEPRDQPTKYASRKCHTRIILPCKGLIPLSGDHWIFPCQTVLGTLAPMLRVAPISCLSADLLIAHTLVLESTISDGVFLSTGYWTMWDPTISLSVFGGCPRVYEFVLLTGGRLRQALPRTTLPFLRIFW